MDHVAERSPLERKIRMLVDDQNAVSVTPSLGPRGSVVFKVEVSDLDAGKIMGAGERTARALRLILASIAEKHDRATHLTCPIPRWNRHRIPVLSGTHHVHNSLRTVAAKMGHPHAAEG